MLEWQETSTASAVSPRPLPPNHTELDVYFLKEVNTLDLISKRRQAKKGVGIKTEWLVCPPGRRLPSSNQPRGSRAGCWLLGEQDQSISCGPDPAARPWEGGGARRRPGLRGVRSRAERPGQGNVLSQEKRSALLLLRNPARMPSRRRYRGREVKRGKLFKNEKKKKKIKAKPQASVRREAGEKCREKKPKETYLRHDKVQSTALPPLLKKKKKVAASRRAPLSARPGSARDPRAPSPWADGAGGMPSPSDTSWAGGAASHPRRGPAAPPGVSGP